MEREISRFAKKNPYIVIGLVLVLVFSLYSAGYFKLGTVVSVSSIVVSPQGYEDPNTHLYTGSFWVVTLLADMTDQVSAVKELVLNGQTATAPDGKTVKSQSAVAIKMQPHAPYYLKQMSVDNSVTIVPSVSGWTIGPTIWDATKRTGFDIPQYSSQHFEFVSGARWEKVTPFSVWVEKDGVQIGQVLQFNTEGGSKEGSIATTDGTLLFRNLGMLGGTYGDPGYTDIMWFSDSYIYESATLARSYLANPYPSGDGEIPSPSATYAGYFYGKYYRAGAPLPTGYTATEVEGAQYPPEWNPQYTPGWIDESRAEVWRPAPIAKYPGDKQTYVHNLGTLTPAEYKSLTEFIESKGIKQITNPGYDRVWKRTADNKLEVDLPFAALNEGAPLFQVLIPTEMADTIVWNPQVSNIKIDSASVPVEVATSVTASFVFKQYSTVASDGFVSVTFNPNTLSVTPSSFQIVGLVPGGTTTQSVTILNPYSDVERNVVMTAKVTNNLGAVTDTKDYIIKQLVRTGGTALLKVVTKDSTLIPPEIDNIFVSVRDHVSNATIKSGYTGQSGSGAVEWDLGAFTGTVDISTAETSVYYSASASKSIVLGQNYVEIQLARKDVVPFDWLPYILAVGIIGATVVGVIGATRRKKRRG